MDPPKDFVQALGSDDLPCFRPAVTEADRLTNGTAQTNGWDTLADEVASLELLDRALADAKAALGTESGKHVHQFSTTARVTRDQSRLAHIALQLSGDCVLSWLSDMGAELEKQHVSMTSLNQAMQSGLHELSANIALPPPESQCATSASCSGQSSDLTAGVSSRSHPSRAASCVASCLSPRAPASSSSITPFADVGMTPRELPDAVYDAAVSSIRPRAFPKTSWMAKRRGKLRLAGRPTTPQGPPSVALPEDGTAGSGVCSSAVLPQSGPFGNARALVGSPVSDAYKPRGEWQMSPLPEVEAHCRKLRVLVDHWVKKQELLVEQAMSMAVPFADVSASRDGALLPPQNFHASPKTGGPTTASVDESANSDFEECQQQPHQTCNDSSKAVPKTGSMATMDEDINIGQRPSVQVRINAHLLRAGLEGTKSVAIGALRSTKVRPFIRSAKSGIVQIERDHCFNMLCDLVVLANVLVLTISTQMVGQGHSVGSPYDELEFAFCIFYTGELLLRLLVHNFLFFHSGWRLMDFALVVVSLLEQVSHFLLSDEYDMGLNVSYFRVMRLLRIAKVLRVLKVMRNARELRQLVDSVLGAVHTLAWSFVLMICTTFIFTLCFVQAAAVPHVPARAPWDSIPTGMGSLFAAATGGLDWMKDLADPLKEDGLHFYLIFLVYISFFLFVIYNAMTSLFVEKLLQNVANDEISLVKERLRQKHKYVKLIEAQFERMDSDMNGMVSFAELRANLEHLSAFAASLDIDETDLLMCFNILTGEGRHEIDIDTFVVGCIKLRGGAKSVDVVDISNDVRRLTQDVGLLREGQAELREICLRAAFV